MHLEKKTELLLMVTELKKLFPSIAYFDSYGVPQGNLELQKSGKNSLSSFGLLDLASYSEITLVDLSCAMVKPAESI